MACEILQSAGAVFTVWGKPERSDMARVLHEVTRAAEQHRGPVVYVTRVPQNAPTPDGTARRDLAAVLPLMMKACSSYHVLLEGTGFLAAVKRGVLTGLLQPVWQARVFFVHPDATTLLARVPPNDRDNVTRLLDAATRRGLLEGDCPSSVPPRSPRSIAMP
jgi:hypothetical protein